MKTEIKTNRAPMAIGTYSQAVRAGNSVYVSGQIPLDPDSMEVVQGDISAQIKRVFENLKEICGAAGAGLNDIVKLTVYLTDLENFPLVNKIMAEYFDLPYPARAVVEVSNLPKNVSIEIDAIIGF